LLEEEVWFELHEARRRRALTSAATGMKGRARFMKPGRGFGRSSLF
jgi:hypothetical protein